MRFNSYKFLGLLFILCVCNITIWAQESSENATLDSLGIKISKFGTEVRGKTAFTAAIGTAVLNGDRTDPQFDLYFSAGFKQFIGSHVNLSLTYHKFNIVYKDTFNEGFMSFDFNVETLLNPYQTFTPFFYAGAGLHASNYFEQSSFKVQGGFGFEVLVSKSIGIKMFTDYNHVFSDEVDGVVFGAADDVYWRIAGGLNLYFGKPLVNKKASALPTVIDSSPIKDDN
ncbi:MAG: Curli production assembly/transport component CsgG [bacterium]